MTHFCYMATPVDQVNYLAEKYMQRRAVIGLLIEHGFVVFDPASAFSVPENPEFSDVIWKTCWRALTLADCVLALVPQGVPSIGVPMEIERARGEKPVAVLSDAGSWALRASGIKVFPPTVTGAEHAIKYLREELAAGRFRSGHQTIHVTGTGPLPVRQHPDDAGFDLFCCNQQPLLVRPGDSVDVPADLCVEPPPGMFFLLIGRSSTFRGKGLLVNTAIIDPGYRGQMYANVRNVGLHEQRILPGERLAQLIPLPAYAAHLEPVRVSQLSPSLRGTSGFGSTGA